MIEPMVQFLVEFDENQIEEQYRDYLKQVRPMTGAGIVKILSKTCSFIDEDKCYLEVGTYRGSTLIAASLNNPNLICFGVDNFEGHNPPECCHPFETIEEGLQDAIARLTNGNVKYFKSDYRKFFRGIDSVDGKKVEVYLYDGSHTIEDQYWGLKLATQVLADEAIVFVDDSFMDDGPAVWSAINQILSEDERFSLIREFSPEAYKAHGDLWCGFVALRFSNKSEAHNV